MVGSSVLPVLKMLKLEDTINTVNNDTHNAPF
jgi:hypothetical protein